MKKTRHVNYPHHVQTRLDPELQQVVESLTPGVTDSTRYRRALRHLYDLALTHPECPPALYSTLAAHRSGRWVTLHNTRPDMQPRMIGAELLPPQHAALLGSPAHQQHPHQPPTPVQPQTEYDRMAQRMYRPAVPGALVTLDDLDSAAPQIPQAQPLNTVADAFANWSEDPVPAPAPTAADPGHSRPKLDRLGRPVTVQTRPLTDQEMQQEGARVTALALAEATGQPLPPFELMPWERIIYEGE